MFRIAHISDLHIPPLPRIPVRELAGNGGFYILIGNVSDVALAQVELGRFFGIAVEANDLEAGFGKAEAQGKTDVTKAEDADYGGVVCQFFLESFQFTHGMGFSMWPYSVLHCI